MDVRLPVDQGLYRLPQQQVEAIAPGYRLRLVMRIFQ
jgi:hypothetical protein